MKNINTLIKNINIFSSNPDVCFVALMVGIVGAILVIKYPGSNFFLLMTHASIWAGFSFAMMDLEAANKLHRYLKVRSRYSIIFLCMVAISIFAIIVEWFPYLYNILVGIILHVILYI